MNHLRLQPGSGWDPILPLPYAVPLWRVAVVDGIAVALLVLLEPTRYRPDDRDP